MHIEQEAGIEEDERVDTGAGVRQFDINYGKQMPE